MSTVAADRLPGLVHAVIGGLCAGHGLQMLLELASAAVITGHVEWALWCAAVVHWLSGVVLAAGRNPRVAAFLGATALAFTAWRAGLNPEPTVAGAQLPVPILVAGSAVLLMLAANRSWPPRTSRPRTRGHIAALTVATLVVSVALTGPLEHRASRTVAYAAPGLWPQRPHIQLAYTIAPGLRSVAGREIGTFTPDLPTCELVFRAWPNNPPISKTGGALTVTGATVDGQRVRAHLVAAGAPASAPPTMLRLVLPRCVNPGQPVGFDLEFGVTLGADADERLGYSPSTRTAWFGSAFPMLSWIRGHGWATDDAVAMNGETAVSEEFALQLTVVAPRDLVVQGVGAESGTTPGPNATLSHRFTADAVRDVTVGIGRYRVLHQSVNGVQLHLATPASGSKSSAAQWATQLSRSITGLSALFGSFPYRDFWITLTPGQSDGTEFPSAIQFSDAERDELPALVTHEVAHQWFYALVGNNQATDPWLDESLATYGEAMVGGDAADFAPSKIPQNSVGLMGRPMGYWPEHGGFDRYTVAVYNQGASVLLKARQSAGGDSFDQALRSYIDATAHTIATPADFARAFHGLPQVLAALREAGALATAQS